MREPKIHLEKVTDDNVDAIVKLRVSKEQRNYVASNNWSLIDAYLSLAEGKPEFPFGIYNGKTLVGFIMISYDNDWTGYERDAWLNSENYRLSHATTSAYLQPTSPVGHLEQFVLPTQSGCPLKIAVCNRWSL